MRAQVYSSASGAAYRGATGGLAWQPRFSWNFCGTLGKFPRMANKEQHKEKKTKKKPLKTKEEKRAEKIAKRNAGK